MFKLVFSYVTECCRRGRSLSQSKIQILTDKIMEKQKSLDAQLAVFNGVKVFGVPENVPIKEHLINLAR